MCYGEECGLGRYISQRFLLRLEERGSICQRLVIAFELGDHTPTSHTPGPSREGIKGVCNGEKCGLGRDDSTAV